jgi:hypothetical protein
VLNPWPHPASAGLGWGGQLIKRSQIKKSMDMGSVNGSFVGQSKHGCNATFIQIFDCMCAGLFSNPLHNAVEMAVTDLLSANYSTLWIILLDRTSFYAPSLAKISARLPSIVSYCLEHKDVLYIDRPSDHSSLNKSIDAADSSSCYIPLSLIDGTLIAVVQSLALKRQHFHQRVF